MAKKLSKETRKKMRIDRDKWEKGLGVSYDFWRSFISPMIKKLKGNKCEVCGSTKNLDSHHSQYKLINIDTVKVLCKKCHKKFEKETIEIYCKDINKDLTKDDIKYIIGDEKPVRIRQEVMRTMEEKVRTKVIRINGIKTTVIVTKGKKPSDIPDRIDSFHSPKVKKKSRRLKWW